MEIIARHYETLRDTKQPQETKKRQERQPREANLFIFSP
jgi:hypothetical protein